MATLGRIRGRGPPRSGGRDEERSDEGFSTLYLPLLLGAKRAHGVEDGQDGDADIGKDGHPHGGQAQYGQQENQHFDANSKCDVFLGDAEGPAGDAHCGGNLGRFVVHEYNIGGFDGGVGAQRAHGDAYIGTG